jgi:hypothetical protein
MQTYMGLVVGTKNGDGAICYADVEKRPAGTDRELNSESNFEAHFLIRRLERIPPAEPIDAIFGRMRTLMRFRPRDQGGSLKVCLDISHTGRQLLSHFEKAFPYTPFELIKFNGGLERQQGDRDTNLGKAWAAIRLEHLLSSFRLHLPRNAGLEAMVEDILDFEVQPGLDHQSPNFKVGNHDAMVSALGLTVQREPGYRATEKSNSSLSTNEYSQFLDLGRSHQYNPITVAPPVTVQAVTVRQVKTPRPIIVEQPPRPKK